MKRMIVRFLRATVATALPAYIQLKMADPKYLALTPVLMALAKFLRTKFPDNPYVPLIPF